MDHAAPDSAATPIPGARNPGLAKLRPYPFARLRELVADVTPNPNLHPVDMGLGEPRHDPPADVLAVFREHMGDMRRYPPIGGIPELNVAIADWLTRRYGLQGASVDPAANVLPVAGTREALFAVAQTFVNGGEGIDGPPLVAMPNPYYQIYEGAALLAGAEPAFLNCTAEAGFLPQLDALTDAQWSRVQMVFFCSPHNPTGAVIPLAQWTRLLVLADQHDFVIASDECYSEIYTDDGEPPLGLLEACRSIGRHDFARCLVFHSLSKRSNLPGLRSGFVAGDARLIADYRKYRTYHGSALGLPVQYASARAWADEEHVVANRAAYRAKFTAVLDVLGDAVEAARPEGGFYLWLPTPGDDRAFTRTLLADHNVRVLPGSYLSREIDGVDPGAGRIRVTLVEPLETCIEGARRLRRAYEAASA